MPVVLVVDDSAYMRGLIKKILKPDGYDFVEAEDGLKALKLATTKSPDCIIMDLIMPGIDGIKTLGVLREQGVNVPVIVVTADIQESVRAQCLEQGATAFINKPPQEGVLRKEVKSALASGKGSTK